MMRKLLSHPHNQRYFLIISCVLYLISTSIAFEIVFYSFILVIYLQFLRESSSKVMSSRIKIEICLVIY